MKDINEVQKYRDGVGGQRQETGSKNNKDKIKKRVQNSDPRNIKDAANILGIPQKEYTPSVQEAFASIFNDIESGRRDLEISQNKLDVLERKNDRHIILPVYSSNFIYKNLAKISKRARQSGDLSTLVLVRSLSVEEVWLDYGPLASQNYLIEISKLINKLAPKSGFVGYLDHGCFAIICNIMTTDEVKPVIERIVSKISSSNLLWEGRRLPVKLSWGLCAIEAGMEPNSVCLAAMENLSLS